MYTLVPTEFGSNNNSTNLLMKSCRNTQHKCLQWQLEKCVYVQHSCYNDLFFDFMQKNYKSI